VTSDVPEYNTHAVAKRTEIPAATFIAWERRYGIPKPYRSAGDQRLYSEHDIAQIIWLRDRTAEGLIISQAVLQLQSQSVPEVTPGDSTPGLQPATPATSDIVVSMSASLEISSPCVLNPQSVGDQPLVGRLVSTMTNFDEREAAKVLAEFAAIGTTLALVETILPQVLASIASQVESGDDPPAALRFAQRFFSRKLDAILDIANPINAAGVTLVAGITTETTDTDVLIEAIRLASQGKHMLVLGTNISITDLVDVTSSVRPDRIALVASTVAAGRHLRTAEEHLRFRFPPEILPEVHAVGPAFDTNASLTPYRMERGPGSKSTPTESLGYASKSQNADIKDA